MQFPSSLFSVKFVYEHVVHPYSSIDTATTWKKSRLILRDILDFHKIDNLAITVYNFAGRILKVLSVEEALHLATLKNCDTAK